MFHALNKSLNLHSIQPLNDEQSVCAKFKLAMRMSLNEISVALILMVLTFDNAVGKVSLLISKLFLNSNEVCAQWNWNGFLFYSFIFFLQQRKNIVAIKSVECLNANPEYVGSDILAKVVQLNKTTAMILLNFTVLKPLDEVIVRDISVVFLTKIHNTFGWRLTFVFFFLLWLLDYQFRIQITMTPLSQTRVLIGKRPNRPYSVDAVEDFCAAFSKTTTLGNFYVRTFWPIFQKYTNLNKCPVFVGLPCIIH